MLGPLNGPPKDSSSCRWCGVSELARSGASLRRQGLPYMSLQRRVLGTAHGQSREGRGTDPLRRAFGAPKANHRDLPELISVSSEAPRIPFFFLRARRRKKSGDP